MQDNWNEFIKECDNASKWIASATEKTEIILSSFERGELAETNLYQFFEDTASKLVSIERGTITAWENEKGEEILPRIIPHWWFSGFYSNRLNTLGYCRIYPDDFRAVNLSRNIMIAGNGKLAINVLAHECLHAILSHDVGHGWEFIKGMEVLNRYLDLQIRVKAKGFREINKYKYVVFCPHCHKAIKYFQRRGKVVNSPGDYYHRACHTALQSKPYTDKYVTF